jgi:hypothetical protein
MWNRLATLALLVGLTAFACPGPRVTGFVIDDPVSGAKVEVTRLDDAGEFVSFVGSTTTDVQGFFRRRVPGRHVYDLVVTEGSFTDAATGLEVDLADHDGMLEAIVDGPGRYAVTPITTMAAELTLQHISLGATAAEAIAAAVQELGDSFESQGVVFDPIRTIPADLDSVFVGELTQEKLYGAVLAGLSQCAADRDRLATGYPPGTITTIEVTAALVRDLRDGAIDGADGSVTPPQVLLLGPTQVPLLDPGADFEEVLADCIERMRPSS